ncbi:MAG: hypothetical protein JKY65_10175 [Planctomycetes bacterium]|nr:hypothetical protein [Planctomycetota bacterium]
MAPASDPIASATAYLASACDAEGRFAYRLHVSVPGDQSAGDYNVLRHAGAIYALDQAWRARHDPNAEAAIRRATRYLVTHHLRPLPGAPKTRVIASRIGEETTRPVAKLGGAGLGLVALSAAHRLDSSLVSLDELRGLARFVLFCQREDGSFRSKRYLDACGWSSFVSLYYPGEAILGLLRLYALDPDPAWLVAAARAAAFLVLSRVDIPASKLPHDHWLLIAGSELLPLWSELRSSPVPAAAVRRHLDRLATLFLDVQAEIRAVGRYPGSFHHSGSVCPSATRLEGLVAYSSLPATSPGAPLRPRLLAGIKLGARFLKASQLQLPARPDLCGAFPRGLLEGDDDAAGKRGEVRVDFTQHSLSALLGAAGLETTRR